MTKSTGLFLIVFLYIIDRAIVFVGVLAI